VVGSVSSITYRDKMCEEHTGYNSTAEQEGRCNSVRHYSMQYAHMQLVRVQLVVLLQLEEPCRKRWLVADARFSRLRAKGRSYRRIELVIIMHAACGDAKSS
jgi:hypothetical protein